MIYCECKPDEALLKELVPLKRKDYLHCSNKTEACKKLEKEKEIIAVLDKDPFSPQPRYLRRLQKSSAYHFSGLEILYDPERKNKVILLNPRLEDWILKIAKRKRINPKDFNLPSNPRKLHRVVNQRLEKFREFLRAIIKESPEELNVLKTELQKKTSRSRVR